ncbi:MAG: hypothetical protein Q4D65_01115 [Peptostreptococcaceae bacterium]|nr:hypothetical protein [Peptostreptococcaceae bacterium]
MDNLMNKEENNPIKDPKIPEQFEDISPDFREKVAESMHLMMQLSGGSPVDDTVLKKIESEHITQYLNLNQSHMENEYKERKEAKILYFAIALLFVLMLFGIIFLLKDSNPEIMEKIIYIAGGFVIGGLGGYGYGKSKN